MANYFNNLPNVYVTVENDGRYDYKLVKNIFRRVIKEAEMEKYSSNFEAYFIPDGMRPDMVAQAFYGDPDLDWVILISNNILDIYDQWPKDTVSLNNYVLDKYGNYDETHHWETKEIVYDSTTFIKEGIEVNETFRVTLPNGDTLSKNDSIYPVTNIEHETYLNEQKRIISIPTSRLLGFFEEQFANLVEYKPHIEIDEDGNKKTPFLSTSKFMNAKNIKQNSQTTIAQTSTSETSKTISSQNEVLYSSLIGLKSTT